MRYPRPVSSSTDRGWRRERVASLWWIMHLCWSSLVTNMWIGDYSGSFFSLPLFRCDNFLPIPPFLTAFSTAFASWVFVTDHRGGLNYGWRSLQHRSCITLDGYLHLHLKVSIGVRLRFVYTYISIITTLQWGTVIQKLRQKKIFVSLVREVML